MSRKPRAISKTANDKKKILTLHEQGLKPSEIFSAFNGKYTYWQIYNTISPRFAKSTSQVTEDGKLKINNLKAEKLVTEMPEVDYSDFASVEKFIEHMVGVIASQMNEKRVSLEKRVEILRKLTFINKHNKAQLIESHLKNPNARIIIAVARRLKPEITDEEIIRVYREESEKIKKAE